MTTEGHKTPDCDGRWIDISTLSEQRALCVKCRGTRRTVPSEDDAPPSAFAPQPIEEGDPRPTEMGEAWTISPYATLALLFFAVAAAAFTVGLVVGSRLTP